jgi:hypothetical protein
LVRAPRLLSRGWHGYARGAWLAIVLLAGVWLAAASASFAASGCVAGDGKIIRDVCFSDVPGAPRYGHDVLGNTPEWDELVISWGAQKPVWLAHRSESVVLDVNHVFEDIAPRVVDLDGDAMPEIVVVQSSFTKGARLVVYRIGEGLEQIATPYIGTRNRWLAPVGAADLDGDGFTELAYVDRPHLARTLRVWRYKGNALEEVAALRGLSNHRIGEPFITGGIRDCGTGPEMITADAAWRRVVATRLTSGKLVARDLGPFSAGDIAQALAC